MPAVRRPSPTRVGTPRQRRRRPHRRRHRRGSSHPRQRPHRMRAVQHPARCQPRQPPRVPTMGTNTGRTPRSPRRSPTPHHRTRQHQPASHHHHHAAPRGSSDRAHRAAQRTTTRQPQRRNPTRTPTTPPPPKSQRKLTTPPTPPFFWPSPTTPQDPLLPVLTPGGVSGPGRLLESRPEDFAGFRGWRGCSSRRGMRCGRGSCLRCIRTRSVRSGRAWFSRRRIGLVRPAAGWIGGNGSSLLGCWSTTGTCACVGWSGCLPRLARGSAAKVTACTRVVPVNVWVWVSGDCCHS